MKHEFSFIVQARSKSTRLPGKILLPFYGKDTILDIQLNNLKRHFPDVPVILATTLNKADDVIADKYADDKKLKVFRGDENNVLDRFVKVAQKYKVENIVRICSDNPFLSMSHTKILIDLYFNVKAHYVSFGFANGTPVIKSHTGLFAEMTNLSALEKLQACTTESIYLEHVTNYLYTNPDKFKCEFIPVPNFLNEYVDKLRLTIDTEQDFVQLQKLYFNVLSKFGEEFDLADLLAEINKNEELLVSMNEQIKNHAK